MTFLRTIGKVLAALFVLLFASLTAAAVWGYTASETLLSDELTTIDETTYDEIVLPLYTTTIERSFSGAEVGTPEWYTVQSLTTADESTQRRMAEQVMPQAWMTEQLERNLPAMLTWLAAGTIQPDLYVDMTPVQQRLADEQLAAALIDSLPACSDAQEDTITAISSGSASADVVLPACSSRSLTEAQLSTAFQEAAATLDDTFPTQQTRAEAPTGRETGLFLNAKATLRALQSLSLFMFVFPLTALLAIWFLAVRSSREFFRWAGVAFLLAGVVTLALPLALMFLPPSRFLLFPTLSDVVWQGAYLLFVILTEAATALLLRGGVVAGVGLLAVGVSFAIRNGTS
jgi:hypothetical protein